MVMVGIMDIMEFEETFRELLQELESVSKDEHHKFDERVSRLEREVETIRRQIAAWRCNHDINLIRPSEIFAKKALPWKRS